jgi:hypothetical protein
MLEDAIAFLSLVRPEGYIALTAIPPERGPTHTETFAPGEGDAALHWLERHSAAGRNLYWTVNPTRERINSKASKQDIENLDWIHVDIDPVDGADPAEARAAAFDLLAGYKHQPTLTNDSGGGIQAFWRLKAPGLYIGCDKEGAEQAECFTRQVEMDLAKMIADDLKRRKEEDPDASPLIKVDGTHDCCRLMRLPGTINRPNKKKRDAGRTARLASVVEYHADRVYSLGDEITAAPRKDAAPAAGQGKVQLEREPPRLKDLDELPAAVTPRTRMLIVQGDDPDDQLRYSSRSEVTFAVVCEMVRTKCTDEQIAAVLTDPDFGISGHTLAQKRSLEYAARQIERARAEAEEPMLRELNAKHFAVGSIGGKFRIASPRRSEIDKGRECLEYQTVADFKNRYMNQRVQSGTDGNNNPKMVPAGDWWLKHPLRRQYETIVFAPGEATDELNEFNLWRGLAVTPEPHPWPLLHRLIHESLAGGNPEYADYILRWLAFAVQHPERAAEVALVFRGARGVGKSTLGHAMRRMFGQHGMSVTHPQHLHGQFNDHLHDCVLLFADEAVAPGEKKAEQMIKVMITEPTLLIEPKGLGKFTARNRLHVMMASNERWVVPAGADERRFAIFDVSPHLAARPGDPNEERNRAFWDGLYAEIEGEGLQGFLHDLLELDLGNWHPRRGVPQTAALNEQKAASLTGFKRVWFDLLASGELPYLRTMRDCGAGHVFVSTSELLEYAQQRTRRDDMTLTEVGDLLARHGCEKDDRRRPRGWIVPPLADARQKWGEVEFPSAWRLTPGWGVSGAAPDENEPY